MIGKSLYDYTVNDVSGLFYENVDAVVIVDPSIDAYKSVVRRGMFETFLKESGIYHDLILDLWFHFNESNEKVTGEYHPHIRMRQIRQSLKTLEHPHWRTPRIRT